MSPEGPWPSAAPRGEAEGSEAGRTIRHGHYTEIVYRQFQGGGGLRAARSVVGALTWPVVWPLAMVGRRVPMVFLTCAEALSIVPYLFGVILRAEFYRFALAACGRNVVIEFGTVFLDRDVRVGDHVLIGRYNLIHHCDFGSHVLTAERCTFLSGARYHRFTRVDLPMALQGGEKKRITVGDDCWVGAHAVVMDDVGQGAVVGAGAVVTRPVEEYAVVVGNPARVVTRREEVSDAPR